MLPAAAEGEHAVDDLDAFDRELRHDAVFVFDFDRQFVMRQHIARFVEDGSQFARDEAMIDVVMHPSLQQTGLQRATRAAAVDEALRDVADLGDVEVRGDQSAVRQHEGERFVRVGAELGEEFSDGHEKSAAGGFFAAAGQPVHAAEEVAEAGADALLVGETLMRSPNIMIDLPALRVPVAPRDT